MLFPAGICGRWPPKPCCPAINAYLRCAGNRNVHPTNGDADGHTSAADADANISRLVANADTNAARLGSFTYSDTNYAASNTNHTTSDTNANPGCWRDGYNDV